jgi:Protein of unknown function (DUF4235)
MESTDLTPENSRDVDIVEVNPMMHLIAPVAAIVGTIIVRKIVSSAYEKATGHPAPLARDPQTPILRAIMWTAVITTTTAVAEVAIYRAINRVGEKKVV